MLNRFKRPAAAALFLSCAAYAQRPANWTTYAGDAQRDGWQRSETKLAAATLKNVQLLWTLKLQNQPKALHALQEPLIVGQLITPHGFKEMAVVAGSDDNIFAIDADLGRLLWQRHFQVPPPPDTGRGSHWLCPGGLTATPVITPPPVFGQGGRGAGPARGGNPFPTQALFALASDGMLRQLNLANGEDMAPPVPLLPKGNGKPYALSLVNDVIYTATGQGCGQLPNGVYAIDLHDPDKKAMKFQSGSGGFWGLGGVAIGTDGTVYAESGDGVYDPASNMFGNTFVALDPKTLALKDWYAPTNWEWIRKRDLDLNVTPVVFPYKGRDLIAGAGKEGRIYLLDSKALGGDNHQTPLYRSPLISNNDVDFQSHGIWGSLTSWEDSDGARWLLAPVWGPKHPDYRYPVTNGGAPRGSIAAFRVEEQNGKTTLAPSWESRDMLSPIPPVVANGIVWALASGEYTQQSKVDGSAGLYSAEDRAKASSPAILYALDAKTGKELWSSGDSIRSFTHYYGLSVANGRIYIGTYDGTFYCFGIPMEH